MTADLVGTQIYSPLQTRVWIEQQGDRSTPAFQDQTKIMSRVLESPLGWLSTKHNVNQVQ